ncbi:MAG TPA: hypothetical protein VI386_15390 [Candidatus Sulfotelmatobacter sp.]
MRNFALLPSACALLLLAGTVHAQQVDIAIGATTTVSSKNTTASQAFVAPPEKGGMYPSISADVIFHKNFGVNAEFAVRAKQGLYNGYQDFRPIFSDINAIYAPRLNKKFTAELMAGAGVETILFYSHFGFCNPSYASCTTYITSNHFMGHVGGGVRYYFWHRFFVRPEAHLYLIPNNTEFHSNYVGRVGASLGYSFAPR